MVGMNTFGHVNRNNVTIMLCNSCIIRVRRYISPRAWLGVLYGCGGPHGCFQKPEPKFRTILP